MNNILSLQPTEVWQYFYEISQIPRASKNMEKIIAYLQNFGKKHHLETLTDEAGNVLIKKPATLGCVSKKTVALQSHIDMVCEKNSDTAHDFATEPIKTYIDGDWVRARGTTLGADNGIGVAAMLAVLAADNIRHGNLECLFTIDEEIGLLGALALKKDFLSADVLINLDSGDENEVFIGCAGGINTTAFFNYEKEKTPENYFYFRVNVGELLGGHSGCDIEKGHANANRILAHFLWKLGNETDLRLCEINGGSASNAIPREAWAVAAVPFDYKENLRIAFNIYLADLESEWKKREPRMKLLLESDMKQTICDMRYATSRHCKSQIANRISHIDKNTSDRLLNALLACPHGVLAMSADIDGLVETSTNLASVKMLENNTIEIVTSQRSSIEAAKIGAMNSVESVFRLAGVKKITHNEGYPGWKPNIDSEILRTTIECYRRLFRKKPRIRAIHAGLECGLFLQKYPNLDIVSFGPTILNPHSPDEMVKISSVDRFWNLLVEMLKTVC